MAEIDGFKYEPWERSGTVARKAFRHAHGGPEELPHRRKSKYVGKDREGCPENDGNAHVYVWVKYVTYYWKDNPPLVRYQKICCGCGKRKRTRAFYAPAGEVYSTVTDRLI